MNSAGVTWLKRRIARATTLVQLRQIWDDMGEEYKRSAEIQAAKDEAKERLK